MARALHTAVTTEVLSAPFQFAPVIKDRVKEAKVNVLSTVGAVKELTTRRAR